MERKKIVEELQDVFRDVLDNEVIVLADDTTANDIEEWDSLTHIQLIVAIEKHFMVKFTSKEILSWQNVGEMVDTLIAKI